MRCDICYKSGMSGNNVSHSNRHTKTRFKANVHKQTLFQNGKQIKVKICSRCLRSIPKSRGCNERWPPYKTLPTAAPVPENNTASASWRQRLFPLC